MHNHIRIILMLDLSESYSRNFIKGISRYADIFGPWSYCKMPPSYKETQGIEGIIRFAKEWNADGIIGQFKHEDEVRKLLLAGLKIMAVDYKEKMTGVCNISGDYFKSGTMAANYLVERGFKNFAFYGSKEMVWSRDREAGFQSKLKEYGFTADAFSAPESDTENFWYYKPSPIQKWLSSLKKPCAVFCCDDNRSEHIVQAAKLSSIHIPDEIAVLGVDNDEIICNYSTPPLSSIQQDEENAGYKVAGILDNMIKENKNFENDVYVEPLRVITRQSTEILAIEDVLIKKAVTYIHENIDKQLTVADLLFLVPLSRRAFENRFKKITAKSVYQYIQKVKTDHAVKMLLDSNSSIEDIALKCGYPDNKNFARIFSKHFGMSPFQYRKNYSFKH